MLRFHFFYNKVREIGYNTIEPLLKGGVPVQMHFTNCLLDGPSMIETLYTANATDEETILFTGMVTITVDGRSVSLDPDLQC